MEPKTYVSLPVEIKAMQTSYHQNKAFKDIEEQNRHIARWMSDHDEEFQFAGDYFIIYTPEGDMRTNPGDWIIRGTLGEFYPCRPEVFEAKYKEVDWDNNIIAVKSFYNSIGDVNASIRANTIPSTS